MNKEWKYIRVYVDIPVKGDVKEREVVWGVQAALDAGHHHIKRRSFGNIAYGRIEAKSKTKVDAKEKERDESNHQTTS